VVKESIEKDALLHIRPNVNVAAFLLVGDRVSNALSEETIVMGSKELL
jgi:hypothetical protein